MWNFSIPYKLKQWFDVIIQPGLTLFKDRLTLVIVASGGDFITGMNSDVSSLTARPRRINGRLISICY